MKHISARAFSAVRWITFASFGKTLFQFLQVVILARILSQHAFGMIAVVMAYVLFLTSVADLGLSNAIFHYRDVDQDELSSLYWLNLLSGLLLTGILSLLSVPIAKLYGNAELALLICAASLTLVIASSCQQLRVRAERDLRFSAVAAMELISAAVGFAVAVIVAFLVKSAWAMVAGMLSAALMQSILCWCWLADGWTPKLTLSVKRSRRFLRFGAYVVLGNLVGNASLQTDVFVGGRFLGGAELGAYSLSRDLSLRLAGLINPILTRVGLPVMATDHKNVEFVSKAYLKTVSTTAAFNFPMYIFVFAFAHEVIVVLFGA